MIELKTVWKKGKMLVSNIFSFSHGVFQIFQNLDSSKLKEFADDNFKFDENGRNFSKNCRKTLWEKEKLLVTSNSPFPAVFSKRLLLQTSKNQGLFVKG